MMPTDADSFGMSNTNNNEHQTVRAELERLTQIIGEHRAPPKLFVVNLPFGPLHQLETTHMQHSRPLFNPPRPPCSAR
eukprot:5504937-Amphidinium_carterae.1